MARTIIVASCTRCEWAQDVGRVMPATSTDPEWLDGDVPDECPECGAGITTETEHVSSRREPDDYIMPDYNDHDDY